MATTQTVLQGKDKVIQGALYMSFELGDKAWKLTLSDGRRGPGRYNVDAGDTGAVPLRGAGPERPSAPLPSHLPLYPL
ncbi:hypothetical protein [Rhizobacter sp. P5_C2]